MTIENSSLVQSISTQLSETDPDAIQQIARAIRISGPELVQSTVKTALEIEAQGGLTLESGKRRTPGGVFFYQLRQQVSKDDWQLIHKDRLSMPVEPSTPLAWDDRAEAVQEALTKRGSVIPPRVRLSGRPKEVKSRDDFVIVTMTDDTEPAALPKGLPRPPSLSTTYRVCILTDQWRRLEIALRNPQDILIVDGYVFPNDKMGTLIILAKSATTKLSGRSHKYSQKAKF
jgi:hypothetical protein